MARRLLGNARGNIPYHHPDDKSPMKEGSSRFFSMKMIIDDQVDNQGVCTLCGGTTHDVSKRYGRMTGQRHVEAHQCENCGYLGKEVDEFA